ncbi:hypothetical protein GF337_16630 [candidate division KSB1 bacterium]|nr:hypothetical protein [candidate division KSB1 bacterium]
MDLIPRKTIESTWIEVEQKSYDELLALKESFVEDQPQVNIFLLKFTDHISQEAIDLTFHYSIIIWEIFKKSSTKSVPEISSEVLYSCIEDREKWLDKIDNFNYQKIDQLISNNDSIHQANILSYALEVILEEGEDNLDFNNEDQSYLFWLLLIIIDAFDKVIS